MFKNASYMPVNMILYLRNKDIVGFFVVVVLVLHKIVKGLKTKILV